MSLNPFAEPFEPDHTTVIERRGDEILVRKTGRSPAARHRLAHEAAILARAQRPGVVELVEHHDDGQVSTLATAWVGTHTLATLTVRSLEQVAGMVAVLADTVQALHLLGIVHGRITPEHVVLDGQGYPVLVGFGDSSLDGDRDKRHERPDDAAALGHLLLRLLDAVPAERSLDGSKRANRRRRAALEALARRATTEDAWARPSAHALAAGIVEAVPGARPAEPSESDAGPDWGARIPTAPVGPGAPGPPAPAAAATTPADPIEPPAPAYSPPIPPIPPAPPPDQPPTPAPPTRTYAPPVPPVPPAQADTPPIPPIPPAPPPDQHPTPAPPTRTYSRPIPPIPPAPPARPPAPAPPTPPAPPAPLIGPPPPAVGHGPGPRDVGWTYGSDLPPSPPTEPAPSSDNCWAPTVPRPAPATAAPTPNTVRIDRPPPTPARPVDAGAAQPGGSRRKRLAALAGGAVVIAAAAAGTTYALTRPDDPAPPPSSELAVPTTVAPQPSTAPTTAGPTTTAAPTTAAPPPSTAPLSGVFTTIETSGYIRHEGKSYKIGKPGDETTVGDFTCSGTSTAITLRPETGQLFVFDRWAETASVTVKEAMQLPAGSHLVPAPVDVRGCATLMVRYPDGTTSGVVLPNQAATTQVPATPRGARA